MKSLRILRGVAIAVPLALLVTSCGRREDAKLAEFKDRVITVADFERAWAKVDEGFLPKATERNERIREFLTTMINRKVMEYKADELGYDKDPAVVQAMDTYRRLGLQTGYLKRRVADQVKVAEEAVREHYRNQGVVLSVKQILCDTPDEAQEAYQMLLDGNDFDSVLRQYSKAPDASEGGKVVTIAYGAYAPTLQRKLFPLKVGEYTEPIETPYGYFIIKVLRRTEPKQKEPFEEIHDRLEQEVRVQEEMLLTNEVTEQIRRKYGVKWYWDGLRVCFEALPPDRPLSSPPSRSEEVYPLLYFDEKDLDRPVVSYKNKTITVKDFSDYYDQASFFNRPRREYRLGGIRTFLTERIMAELVVDEMKASNIEKDPEVSRAIEAKRYELMVNRLWNDMVNKQTEVDPRQLRNYYNDNLEAFRVPEKRRFGVILCGDLETAQKAYEELKNGELFRNVALAYSIDEETRRKLGETDLLSRGEQPEIDEVGFALPRLGAISEPFQTSRGWMILKLVERVPSRLYSFEEARPSIESALKQQANDKRLNQLLEKWKKELGVVMYEKNFRKVRFPERKASTATKATA